MQKNVLKDLKGMRNANPYSLNQWIKYIGQLCMFFVFLNLFFCIKFIFIFFSHEIAEVAGLVGISFGQEGLDRYIVVYKKEYSPTEDEVNSRKDGDDQWNEEKAKNYAINREHNKLVEIENSKKTEERAPPTSNYKDKYVHLIGKNHLTLNENVNEYIF